MRQQKTSAGKLNVQRLKKCRAYSATEIIHVRNIMSPSFSRGPCLKFHLEGDRASMYLPMHVTTINLPTKQKSSNRQQATNLALRKTPDFMTMGPFTNHSPKSISTW